MCVFFLRYVLKERRNRAGEDMYEFFLRYVLKVQGNRPRDPSGLMCMCVYSLLDMH